jgi:hypothetical protein
MWTSTYPKVLQYTHYSFVIFDPLLLALLGDIQGTRECIMDVLGVEGCSDLVEVTVDEPLGPCHDGLGLGALFGSGRHGSDREGA